MPTSRQKGQAKGAVPGGNSWSLPVYMESACLRAGEPLGWPGP